MTAEGYDGAPGLVFTNSAARLQSSASASGLNDSATTKVYSSKIIY
jgi:hypothetical protein